MDFQHLGPYTIGPRLGKGGMGSVYRGENVETKQGAAIKALAPQLATSEGFRERFEAEIESLKTLRHEGIVRLYGYGEESGTLFYAMELVDGRSLEEELKAGRRFNWREVVDIAIQVCRALKHAHDHGIIHRDIKPANILLDKQERVKLADFGIARLFGSTQLTMAGGVLGTADYMSPEQAEGRPVTDRCDQYSLGCVMYALLAGRPPFQAKSLPEMLQLQRFAEPEPVRRYAPRAPEQLEYCIGQLLKKNPNDRFPNTLVLSRHLEAMRRALSRPFDHSKPMPGEEPSTTSNGSVPVPIELAVTRADDAGEAASDFDVDPSVDIDLLPTPSRDAATIDSMTAEPVKPAIDDSATSTDHFTTIDSQHPGASRAMSPSIIAASLGLVAMVVAFGYLAYRITRPYDADTLYTVIHSESTSPTVDELRPHSDEINEFVRRFPNDPRVSELRGYQEELELERQQRRFATLARGRGEDDGLLTAERLYLAALRKSETAPAMAAAELQNLLALFEGGRDASVSEKHQARLQACLELARRQLGTLEQQIAIQNKADLATLDARLAAAEKLHASNPTKSVAICRAVVELYRDKAWAAEAVEQASQLLEAWQ
jgi:eukaryotic-like serine/threonine-protein kinase